MRPVNAASALRQVKPVANRNMPAIRAAKNGKPMTSENSTPTDGRPTMTHKAKVVLRMRVRSRFSRSNETTCLLAGADGESGNWDMETSPFKVEVQRNT